MKAKTNIIQFEAAAAVIEYNITDNVLAELRNKYKDLKASNNENYKLVKNGISELRSLRTGIEKRRVEYKADALEYGRRIDAEAKRVTALISEIEIPLKAEQDAWDNEKARIKLEKEKADRERIAAIIERIEKIKNAPLKHQGKNSAELSEIMGIFEINFLNMDQFDYAEFTPQANGAKFITAGRLKEMRDLAQKQEIEAIRLAAERKQLEEEKAAWETKKAKEMQISIPNEIPVIVTDNQEIEPLGIITWPITNENLSKAIAQVESARNQSNIIINTANNFTKSVSSNISAFSEKKQEDLMETEKIIKSVSGAIQLMKENFFPKGKPTYDELVWIIEKMLPRITAKTSDEFKFYENVKNSLKLIRENN